MKENSLRITNILKSFKRNLSIFQDSTNYLIHCKFQSIVVQGGSVMYKDNSDQLHPVKRRRSQEQDGASIVPTSPLKV